MKRTLLALLALAFAPVAQAADLGGNCCADLEDRVAELEATTARKGNRKVSLTVYGQVNAGVLSVDLPGFRSTKLGVGGSDDTFVGFQGSARISERLSAGYVLEVDLSQQGWGSASPVSDVAVRQSYIYVTDAALGTIAVGQQGSATWHLSRISATENSTYLVAPMLSLGALGAWDLGGNNLQFDGKIANAVSYVSPSLGGLTIAGTWAQDSDLWDVALRYGGEYAGFKFAAGLGYRQQKNAQGITLNIPLPVAIGDAKTVLGTASLKHVPTGLFVQGEYAHQEIETFTTVKLNGWTVQAGIEGKVVSWGQSTAFGEYGSLDVSFVGGSVTPTYYGVGFIQGINLAGMEVYAGWRRYDLKDLNGPAVDTIQAGARIRF